MSRYPFLFLLLVFGSGILSAIESGATDLTSTPRMALGTTNPAPVPTDPTAEPTPKTTTAASNGTTVSPAVPTTSARNATTAATTVPTNGTTVAPPLTTSASNATTAPPPAPTNATTAPPPAPTNATTAPPPVPTNGTTVAPPVTTSASNATTALPTVPTNATTVAPPVSPTAGSNATTAPTTTATPTTVPPPAVGNYNVSNGANGTTCLMATMGLRIGYNDGKTAKNINLDPSATVATGKCGAEESDHSLDLSFENSTIAFLFSVDAGKFRLHGVNVTLAVGTAGTFSAANANLSLWEASVGSSYMCRRDQAYNITDTLVLYTWGLQVQPYRVQNNRFATAHDCAMDDSSLLIPIVVGAALAGLILIVMVAYAIGRRKTYVGYQTL